MNKAEILTNLIMDRRAIYPGQYTNERVDDALIERILENANWAPTHRRTEPWRFHVFSGNSLLDLSNYVAQWYKDNTPPSSFSDQKYKKTKSKALKSSHVIAICMKRDPMERLPEWEEIAAVACAVQNMWLTCTASGLGCYWSTPASALNAGEFLGLEEGERCLGWFYIGVPETTTPATTERGSIRTKVKWH